MKGSKKPTFILFIRTIAVCALCTALQSQSQDLTALVTSAAGRVAFRTSGSGQLQAVRVGITRLKAGDMIVTSRNSKATLQIEGKQVPGDADHPSITTIEIGPKSRVLMSRLFSDLGTGGEQVQIGVAQGQVISNVRRINPANERFEVETPTAIAAVRGTRFLSDVLWKGSTPQVKFRVERGQIELFSRTGKRLATLDEGEIADIAPNGAAANVSSSGSTTSSSGGAAASVLGTGKAKGLTSTGLPSSEPTDSIRSIGTVVDEVVVDDESDDVGGHHQ